jgi:hypothetical protein
MTLDPWIDDDDSVAGRWTLPWEWWRRPKNSELALARMPTRTPGPGRLLRQKTSSSSPSSSCCWRELPRCALVGPGAVWSGEEWRAMPFSVNRTRKREQMMRTCRSAWFQMNQSRIQTDSVRGVVKQDYLCAVTRLLEDVSSWFLGLCCSLSSSK